jgi:hypothetical protein
MNSTVFAGVVMLVLSLFLGWNAFVVGAMAIIWGLCAPEGYE